MLAVQAAYILVPASRMSTGDGILPSYLGLCWCNFLKGTGWTPAGIIGHQLTQDILESCKFES